MTAKEPALITRSRLRTDLDKLGIQRGMVVMLHVSVRAIGWVVGGPDIVLEALLDVLGPEGTLMMIASWEGSPYELASWPVERQELYIQECPPFDPLTSRADRSLSILTEYLRTRPGAYRSAHPDFSFSAIGKEAQWLTSSHPLKYGYGPGSPLARLTEIGGQVLLLGAPLETITLLHYAEHLANIPDKPIVRYRMPVLRDGGKVWVELEEFDTNKEIFDSPEGYSFAEIALAYLASGNGFRGRVGEAASYLFAARSLVEFGVAWLEERAGK